MFLLIIKLNQLFLMFYDKIMNDDKNKYIIEVST